MITFFEKNRFEKKIADVRILFHLAQSDYARFDEFDQRKVRMTLYHMFEELWKIWPNSDDALEVFEKYTFHSSSEKLEKIFFIQFLLAKNDVNPRPEIVAKNFFATACMAERLNRSVKSARGKQYASVRTKSIFSELFHLTPTLQVAMWRVRFGDLNELAPLHPLISSDHISNAAKQTDIS